MRRKPRMSVSKFERLHPGVVCLDTIDPSAISPHKASCMVAKAKNYKVYTVGRGKSPDEARADLSQRLLRLTAREVCESQDWRDAQSGATVPLSAHHHVHRAHQGTHEQENLSGLGIKSHSKQHAEFVRRTKS